MSEELSADIVNPIMGLDAQSIQKQSVALSRLPRLLKCWISLKDSSSESAAVVCAANAFRKERLPIDCLTN